MRIHFTTQHRSIVAIYIVLVVMAVFSALSLRINYVFENFFPKDDPDYLAYKAFREDFDNDDLVVQLAVKPSAGIFDTSSLGLLLDLEESIVEQESIDEIRSLLRTRIPVKTPLGWISNALLRNNESTLEADSMRIAENPRLRAMYISNDGQFYAMQLILRDSTTDDENKALIQFIESRCAELGFEAWHIGGFINTQVNYVRLLEAEFPFAAASSAISMCLILLLLYRSVNNALLPTLTVVISLLLFFGYLGLIGRDLNITSTLFITIMTIVAVSDIVHLQTYYHKYLLKGEERSVAIQKAWQDTWLNLLMTSVTTAVGFLTFLSSSIPHIRTFGLDAGVGVLMAFLIAITLGPVLLYYFPPNAKRLQKEKSKKIWDKFLHGIYLQGKNNRSFTYLGTLIIIVLSLIGIQRIESDQKLSGNFDADTQLKKDFQFFEDQFGGIRALEMHLKPGEGKEIIDLAVLRELEKMENYLESKEVISSVISPATWMKGQNMSVSGARAGAFRIPEDQEAIDYLLQQDVAGGAGIVINANRDAGRLLAKMNDVGRLRAAEIHEEIEQWYRAEIDTSVVSFRITGSALLIDKNNDNLLREMLISLTLAFICVSILMALLFKRVKMIVISIFPNIIPLLAVAGLMGWLGIPLNAATSLIFTIGFVIAIDDTIHFLARFRREYEGKNSLELSIKNTLGHTGKAILHTTIILIVVYTASIFSNFTEISQHAILVAATLIFALLSDFYLLPALLRQAAKKKDLF